MQQTDFYVAAWCKERRALNGERSKFTLVTCRCAYFQQQFPNAPRVRMTINVQRGISNARLKVQEWHVPDVQRRESIERLAPDFDSERSWKASGRKSASRVNLSRRERRESYLAFLLKGTIVETAESTLSLIKSIEDESHYLINEPVGRISREPYPHPAHDLSRFSPNNRTHGTRGRDIFDGDIHAKMREHEVTAGTVKNTRAVCGTARSLNERPPADEEETSPWEPLRDSRCGRRVT